MKPSTLVDNNYLKDLNMSSSILKLWYCWCYEMQITVARQEESPHKKQVPGVTSHTDGV